MTSPDVMKVNLLMIDDLMHEMNEVVARLQTTQPTSGGAVTADSSCCATCVEPTRPQQWGPDLPFFGHAGHADPLDGWRCCSQNRNSVIDGVLESSLRVTIYDNLLCIRVCVLNKSSLDIIGAYVKQCFIAT